MTIKFLLDELKKFVADAVKDYKLPTSLQKGDQQIETRAPAVHLMRLPDSRSVTKIAPYILIRYVTSISKEADGQKTEYNAVIRMIFCVYGKDEEEGALNLVNVMDSVRIKLLKKVVVGKCFRLDKEKGLESLVYEDDTAPYYAGEMVGTFQLPPIEREVDYGSI